MTKQESAALAGRGIWRRLLEDHVRPHAAMLALAIAAMIVAAVATAANAWLMEPVLDKVFLERRQDLLWIIPGAVVLAALVKSAATYAQSVIMTRVGQGIISDIQARLFDHLLAADLQFFHDNPPGKLIARFINDVATLRGVITQATTGLVKDAVTAACLVGLLFWQDWQLALVTFFVFPLALVPARILGRRMRRVTTGAQERIGELSALLDEAFQGARQVKAYAMEPTESARARTAIERLRALSVKSALTRAASHPIMETLSSFAIAAVILYGGHQVVAGRTTPGAFFSFITALLLAYQPVRSLANLNVTIQEGLAAAARVFELLDMQPSIREKPGAATLPPVRGHIAFEGIGFAYPQGGVVFDGLDLRIEAGRTIAFVGPSGGGKSTLLNLLPRLFDPQRGRVTIDGADVRDVTLSSLRRSMALVSQDTALFHDTIRANIAYGRPDATDAEIERAAAVAGAATFISEFREGYATVVGTRGAKLSGGQRQRIAIARAVLKDAPILLLDEATSALDIETERQVQAALAPLMRGRTTLVVAHRLSTIVDADMICVVDGGRIVESGTHAELLARGGAYARLHAAQAAESGEAGGRP